MGIGALALRWLITAGVTMAAVAMVSPGNKGNTLLRALGVTAVVAIVVSPIMWFWFLLVPALVAFIAWILVYTMAYGLGFGQAIAVGIVQVGLSFLVDLFLVRGVLRL